MDNGTDFSIAYINLENIRGLKTTKQLELDRFNVIVGANNTGKTSFMETIRDLALFYSKRITHLKDFNERSSASMTIRLNQNITSIDQKYQKEPQSSNSKVFEESLEFLSKIRIIKAELDFSTYEKEVETDIKQVLEEGVSVGRCPRKVIHYLLEKKQEKYFQFEEFLREKLHLNIKLISEKNDIPVVKYKESHNTEYLDLDSIGSGTKKLILCILNILLDPPLLLLDEPENHLHVNFMKILINYIFAKRDQQVVISTHSPLLINYIFSKTPESTNFLTFTINESGNNEIEVHPISGTDIQDDMFPLKHYSQLGLELSDIFVYEKIILVEGLKDLDFYPSIFRNLVPDWNKKNICIKQTFGKTYAERIVENQTYPLNITHSNRYIIPMCIIVDKDFSFKPKEKLKKYFSDDQIISLKRHSIENYLCDIDYLEYYIHKKKKSRKRVFNSKKKEIYPQIINDLLYFTVFRYAESNQKMLNLLPSSKEYEEFTEEFLYNFFENKNKKNSKSNYLEKIEKAILQSSKMSKYNFKRKYIKLVNKYTKKKLQEMFKEESWINFNEKIKIILKEVKEENKRIIYHARGHNVASSIIDKLIELPNDELFRATYGEYIASEQALPETKQEIAELVSRVMVSLNK